MFTNVDRHSILESESGYSQRRRLYLVLRSLIGNHRISTLGSRRRKFGSANTVSWFSETPVVLPSSSKQPCSCGKRFFIIMKVQT